MILSSKQFCNFIGGTDHDVTSLDVLLSAEIKMISKAIFKTFSLKQCQPRPQGNF